MWVVLACVGVASSVRGDLVTLASGVRVEASVMGLQRDIVTVLDASGTETQYKMAKVQKIEFTGGKPVTAYLKGKKEGVSGVPIALEKGTLTLKEAGGQKRQVPLMYLERATITGVAKPFEVISNNGQTVDLKRLVVPGKITVVDFFAEWCGPCRAMGPLIEGLVKEDTDVAVRKVDIVRWDTPVCQQYGIRSVPNVRVFDRAGNQVGNATCSFDEVKRLIEKAKQ